jgi:hypothetical protein
MAYLGLHFDLHPGKNDTELGADITEEMIENLLRRVCPDYVQYDCKGHAGYTGYPTQVGWASPGIQKDSLALWRKVTREFGVGLFIHYSGVWDSVAVEHHPDWARQDAEGNPDRNATSTFGPYVDELLIPQLMEVADAYDLDGVWVDGDCWAVQVDFSPAAVAAFQTEKGIQTVPKKRGEPGWNEFLEFQRRRFIAYVTRYADALHAQKPDFELTSNWLYSTFVPERPTAPVDFLSGDYSPGDSVNTARLEARYLASTGKPWDLMAWGFNKGDDSGWSHKPAIQLQQEASIVLSQGGGFQIYYQPTRRGFIDDWLVDIMADVATFCRERQSVSHKTEPIPQILLLLPGQSFYASSDWLFGSWGGMLSPLSGALHALLESHYSVDICAEWGLHERLAETPLVVVPECSSLPEDTVAGLTAYVENGGNLLVLGAAMSALFGKLLGVECDGDAAETSAYVKGNRSLAWCGGSWRRVRTTTAAVVGTRTPTTDGRSGIEIAATVNRHGRGSVGAIYGPVGSVYHRSHYPAIRELIGSVVARLLPEPMVALDAPPYVEMALRRKAGATLIHLTNLAGMQVASRYALVDAVPPAGPVTLRIRSPKKPLSVERVPAGQFASQWENGVLTVEFPLRDIHAVVVVR